MEETAQINIEYLLIAVTGIAVVTMVALYLKSVASTTVESAKDQATNLE